MNLSCNSDLLSFRFRLSACPVTSRKARIQYSFKKISVSNSARFPASSFPSSSCSSFKHRLEFPPSPPVISASSAARSSGAQNEEEATIFHSDVSLLEKVTVIGGGLSGMLVSLALNKIAGVQNIDVFESRNDILTGGHCAMLRITPNGVYALRESCGEGLVRKLFSRGYPQMDVRINIAQAKENHRQTDGEERKGETEPLSFTAIPGDAFNVFEEKYGSPALIIQWRRLLDSLIEEVEERNKGKGGGGREEESREGERSRRRTNIKIHSGHKLLKVEQQQEEVEEEDGVSTLLFETPEGVKTVQTSGLVIGSDGVHSSTRSFVIERSKAAGHFSPESEIELRGINRTRWRGTVDLSKLREGLVRKGIWLQYVVPRVQGFLLLHGGGGGREKESGEVSETEGGGDEVERAFWACDVDNAWVRTLFPQNEEFENVSKKSLSGEEMKERVLKIYKGWDIVEHVVGATDPSSFQERRGVELSVLPRWFVPNVLLIGDAAHTLQPVTGQGGNMALEDALLLAQHLSRAQSGEFNGSVRNALDAFILSRVSRIRIIESGHISGDPSKRFPVDMAQAIKDSELMTDFVCNFGLK